MILSNTAILEALQKKVFEIEPLAGNDPTKSPFNTSAVDLRLGNEIQVPEVGAPVQLDLSKPGIAKFLAQYSKMHTLTENRPFSLEPHQFILANTLEKVNFPLDFDNPSEIYYSARVEGKSSLARCGILVHFTAPTIHAGFFGPITLEIINLGVHKFLLTPGMFICQLIIEEVKGCPANAPNQFKGQTNPAGIVK